MTELNAFHWRENGPWIDEIKPRGRRRARGVAQRVAALYARGSTTRAIATKLEVTPRYIQRLLKAKGLNP